MRRLSNRERGKISRGGGGGKGFQQVQVAYMQGFAVRVVLGLGDRACGGEGAGVGGERALGGGGRMN